MTLQDFWCGYVLQLAHKEPFITDCILAISTLYEHPQFMASFRENPYRSSLEERNDLDRLKVIHPNVPPPPDKFHSSALWQYNRAMRRLRERIETGTANAQLALVSCVLFFCIEVIRDNVFAAFGLVKRGVLLLRQFESTTPEESHADLFKLIKLIFSRMGVTAASLGHPLPGEEPELASTEDKTWTFRTMPHARDALFTIMADSHDFILDAASWRDAVIKQNTGYHAGLRGGEHDINTSVTIETMYGARYRWTEKVLYLNYSAIQISNAY